MQEAPTRLEVEELQETLRVVQELLAHEKPLARQYLVGLRGRLEALHAADIAYVLEALPLEERLVVWDLVKADRDGEILLEVSDAVREALIASMDSEELVAAAETLEADELADIAADLPASVIEEVVQSLPAEERERLRAALSYPEGSVGALMDFDHVAVRDDVTLEAVTRYLRRMDVLPDHTDQLFVVDRAAGGPRGADADRRRHRRQFRQPDDHHDRARAGAGADSGHLLGEAARQGDGRRAAEWRGVGNTARRDCVCVLRQCGARRRDGARHASQPGARRDDGSGDPLGARALRQGPRGRLVGADYRVHRLRRIFYFSRT